MTDTVDLSIRPRTPEVRTLSSGTRTRRRAAFSATVIVCASAMLAAQSRVDPLPAERDFVKAFDKAWSTGERKAVLPFFDFVHEGLRRGILRRIDPGVRRESRKTKILECFEIQRSDGRTQRAAFLSTRIQPLATPQRAQELFEVLVFRPRENEDASPPRAMLLLPTTRHAQEHVRPIDESEAQLRGLPIGKALQGGCPACNWKVRAPDKGNWAVILRDGTYAACAENVEIYNLDVDLMLGLRVEPDSIPNLNVDLGAYVARTRSMMGKMFERDLPAVAPEEVEVAGTTGFTTDVTIDDRTWRLIGLRAGPVTYLLNVQGPTDLLASEEMKVQALVETFHLLSTGENLDLKKLLAAHARGKFLPSGRFRSRVLGVSIDAPFADWEHEQPMGAFALQAYWSHKTKGRFVMFVLDSAQERLDTGQAKRYLSAWLAREQRCGTVRELAPGPVERRRIAGIRSGWVEFSCASRKGGGARARAFACAVPHGKRLVLVHGCAEAGADQDEVFEKMIQAAQSLRLDD